MRKGALDTAGDCMRPLMPVLVVETSQSRYGAPTSLSNDVLIGHGSRLLQG